MPRAKSLIKLEKLTPEQEAILPRKRDEWLAVGLSTEPIDVPRFKAGMEQAFGVVGKTAPRIVIVLDSWRACNYAASVVLPGIFNNKSSEQVSGQVRDQVSDQVYAQVRDQVSDQVSGQVRAQVSDQVSAQVYDQVRDQVRDQVGDQVRDQVYAQVYAQVGAQVHDQVRAQVYAQVRDQVRDQVSAQVYAQVRAQVYAQVSDQVRDQVGDQVRAQVGAQVRDQATEKYVYTWFWNQFDSGYLSYYDTIGSLGVDVSKLAGIMEMARSAGPAWLWWDVALVCDRPMAIHRDDKNRLHHESSASLLYRDGSGVWSWHGVRVPQFVIERPQDITIALIAAEENAEIKRVMIERFGHGRYIAESGLKPIQSDDFGTLYSDGNGLTVVRVVDVVRNDDGTEKVHYLPINSELRPMGINEDTGLIRYGEPQAMTARNAVASTFGLKGADYAPVLET